MQRVAAFAVAQRSALLAPHRLAFARVRARALSVVPPAAPPPTADFALSDLASPRALFAKVRALGPTALVVYGVLWAGPLASTYALVANEVVAAADPLQVADTYLPAVVVDTLRSSATAFGLALPPKGEALGPQAAGVIWGLLVTDLVEPLRLAATLLGTPRIVRWWAARKAT